ncbi:MAG: exonuclease domain-containing protein [Leptospiraceae bacterium]|nr:exonuclease domain-containing protein [Leptospiraceae bacterium]
MNYIIFDLEATCEDNEKIPNSEIIEIGAIRLNENLEEVGRFNQFIKPIFRPTLSAFCKKLTTIKQEEVDNAKLFPVVIQEYENWILEKVPVILYSWGSYDKNQILRESEQKGYNGKIKSILENHRNLKEDYRIAMKTKAEGMTKALKECGLKLEGTHHRGIDDAINIANIFRVVKRKIG